MVNEAVHDGSSVLDAGAGTSNRFRYDLKDRVQNIVGVGADIRVESNPLLHRGIRCDISDIPVDDNSFDVVFSRYVLEHISEPTQFLREMHRVLKPGGRFIFLTPNKWHYVTLAARMTPHWFHEWYNSRLRASHNDDTFPTKYRLNTTKSLNRQFAAAGFDRDILIQRESCPNYLLWSYPTFFLGLMYERVVNSTDLPGGIRVNLLGTYKNT